MLQNLGNNQREGGLGVVAEPDRLDYAFYILQGLAVLLVPWLGGISPEADGA